MKAQKRIVSLVSIERATNNAKRYAEEYTSKVERFQKDADKEKRQNECKCKACFYFFKSRVGGAAMTHIDCGICDTEMLFGSTAVNPICNQCNKENGLCVQCGGDIEMKVRRKKPYPFFTNKNLLKEEI
jgi:hypothetical protein